MLKKLNLISVLFATVMFSLNAFADEENPTSGDCGEHCSWKMENDVLTITGYGKMKNYIHGDYDAPWYWNKDNISKIVIENESEEQKLTSIGRAAFDDMHRVSEIVLPDGIEEIGHFACYNCRSLEKIDFPEGLKSIGTWAFGQARLSQIDIPESITNIYAWAFQLTDLTHVVIPENTLLDPNAFFNDSRKIEARTTPIIEIYCSQNNMEQCRKAVAYRGDLAQVIEYEKLPDGKYFAHGKFYDSLNSIGTPNYIKKRIYTIDEANRVAGKVNSVKIRYR